MHDKVPKYLTDLIESYVPGYSGLRSSTQGLLQERNSKNQRGDISFWVAAPILWNNLPSHEKSSNSIISFKKNLKTHLFLEAFKSLCNLPSLHFVFVIISVYCNFTVYYCIYVICRGAP